MTKKIRPIQVYCKPEERAILREVASSAGLSLSSFLLNCAMGYHIKSVVDARQMMELLRVNADMGRLGGLLKLWLTDEAKTAVLGPTEIRRLLTRLEEGHSKILEVVDKVIPPGGNQ